MGDFSFLNFLIFLHWLCTFLKIKMTWWDFKIGNCFHWLLGWQCFQSISKCQSITTIRSSFLTHSQQVGYGSCVLDSRLSSGPVSYREPSKRISSYLDVLFSRQKADAQEGPAETQHLLKPLPRIHTATYAHLLWPKQVMCSSPKSWSKQVYMPPMRHGSFPDTPGLPW